MHDDGTEVLLYDPRRDPPEWTGVLQPNQCAVLLSDVASGAPRTRDGGSSLSDRATCIVFDHVDAAAAFCEKVVARDSAIRCEVFDSQGRGSGPLLVITHPDHRTEEHSISWWSRHRKRVAIVMAGGGFALMGYDSTHDFALTWPTLISLNLLLTAYRFLYWDAGVKHADRQRLKRLEAHRRLEAGVPKND